jgi:RNA polymerase sigma-70 factor (ECF subfamily)
MASSLRDSIGPGAPEFLTTRWSVVLAANGESTSAQVALGKLCHAYWYPLYVYVRRQGEPPHDAQDLTQEFFSRLLAKGWLDGVDRERGRFRSWLLASLKHFLANEWDKSRAQKRGGGAALFSIDEVSAEERLRHEPVDVSAEKLYERRWAWMLLDQVLARLRVEMAGAGKLALFEALKFCLTGEKSPYAQVAGRLRMSEGAVKVAVHRLRERYRALLRAEIAETVARPEEIEDELRALLAALSP